MPVLGGGSATTTSEVVAAASAGSAYTISTATATIHDLTLNAATCALTLPTASAGASFTLTLRQDVVGSRTVTWPSNVLWQGGAPPTLTLYGPKLDVLTFVCVDGSNWLGFIAGQNYGSPLPATAVVTDTFNRADSATTLGTTDTGQAWSALLGTWGIASGRAYTPTGTVQASAVVESGVSNCIVQCDLSTSGDAGLIVRATDEQNYLVFTNLSGSLYKRVAGVFTQLGSTGPAGSNGDTVQVVTSGSSLTVKRNGVIIVTATETFNQTATKHGIRVNNSNTPRIDNFTVTT